MRTHEATQAERFGEDLGVGYYVVLSRILQMDFGEYPFHALR
jgi:hypothetical protein